MINNGIIQFNGEMRLTNSTIGGRPEPKPHADPVRQAAVRLCLAADVEKFSRLRTPEAVRAQHRLLTVLAEARRRAHIDEAAVELQGSGDGEFAVLPPALDESAVIPALLDGLRAALIEINSDLAAASRLRIRVALHRGFLTWAKGGWLGDATTAIHRLLDSAALRQSLSGHVAADFALIVPDELYHDVVKHHCHRVFSQTTVDVPAKNFRASAWIHVGEPG